MNKKYILNFVCYSIILPCTALQQEQQRITNKLRFKVAQIQLEFTLRSCICNEKFVQECALPFLIHLYQDTTFHNHVCTALVELKDTKNPTYQQAMPVFEKLIAQQSCPYFKRAYQIAMGKALPRPQSSWCTIL